jgi:transposase
MPEFIAYERVCGIDVAKLSLQVCILADTTLSFSIPNGPLGFRRLVHLCLKHRVQIVTLEATGGLQRPVTLALLQAHIPVAVINPFRIHHYAISEGILGKTDSVDAHTIATFTLKIRPEPTPVRSELQEHLARLTARKTQLTHMKVAEENRLHQESDREVLRGIKKFLRILDREIASTDSLLEKAVETDPELLAKVQTADATTGVGRSSAITLIVTMPELGTLTSGQAGALAGLAPFNRDSGQTTGERHIFGGRVAIRSTLYLCALSAIRYAPEIRQMYQRLLQAGKCKMKALVACMHKMIIIINARIRDALAARRASLSLQTPTLVANPLAN